MEIITCTQQKGGTGKTATAAGVGQCLADLGKTVLFVDLDAQGNLTDILKGSTERNVYEVLTGTRKPQDAIQRVYSGYLLASSPALATYHNNDITRLKRALTALKYDYAVIDCPPALSELSLNALNASDGVIIPAGADAHSMKALRQLYATVQAIEQNQKKKINLLGVVLTRWQGRRNISRQAAAQLSKLARLSGTSMFNTVIRECVSIPEAEALGLSIYQHAPKSNAAADYRALTIEVLERIETIKRMQKNEQIRGNESKA